MPTPCGAIGERRFLHASIAFLAKNPLKALYQPEVTGRSMRGIMGHSADRG